MDCHNPLLAENLVSLAEAAKHHFRPPRATSTVWRWGKNPVKGALLETVQVGGQYYTSVEAIGRFLDALNQPKAAPIKTPRTRKQKRASQKKADEILKARGI